MLGKPTSLNNNKPIKKSAYEDFEEKGTHFAKKDYQKIIDEKDQIIRKLEFKVEKLEKEKEELVKSNPANANSFYKKKL